MHLEVHMSGRLIRGAGAGLLAVLLPAAAGGQVLKVAEMTGEQIRALDRATTVVILPGGILEQHGPHLPSFADGYLNQSHADALAEAIARRPGWRALVFPIVPLGSGGANEIAGKYSWPGTYAVRTATLRAIFMDLAHYRTSNPRRRSHHASSGAQAG